MFNYDNIKVSVIVPVYNAEMFLEKCLYSLKSQSLNEMEVIIINDGSTDSSHEICEKYVKDNNNFRLITQKNEGLASARRVGMLEAKGEYIGFIDSDDWAEHNMYEDMYNTAVDNDCDIVFCNCYRDSENGTIKCKKYIRTGFYNRKQIEEEILPRTLAGLDNKGRTHVIKWANWLRLYRRNLIVEHNIYNDPRFRRCQDLQITFEATLYAQTYYYMGDSYLYHNRVVKDSLSRGYTKNLWKNLRILIERLYVDVDDYKEIDLHKQMDLCAFFFAVLACKNEGKLIGKESNIVIESNIHEIVCDSVCIRFLDSISYSELCDYNQLYYEGIQKRNVAIILQAIKKEKREESKNAIKSKMLKNKAIKMCHNVFLKTRGIRL